MNLFTSTKGIITTDDFSKHLESLQLSGKSVIVYSRLLSLGRFLSKESIKAFLRILTEHIGPEGTLVIPTYTLNSYKEPREFDFTKSKIMSGVLGDIAALDSQFKRTIHPVYSNAIFGKNVEILLNQDATTCFGENSLFDLFSKLENAYVMMIGLNFNGPTLYHYYDQKFNAPGRYLKEFMIRVRLNEHQFSMRFNSYVKDYSFYNTRMNCLARFDALLEEYKAVERIKIGDDFIHMISERDFQMFYRIALEVDQEYFLMSEEKDWDEYYMKNNFTLYHNTLPQSILSEVEKRLTTFH